MACLRISALVLGLTAILIPSLHAQPAPAPTPPAPPAAPTFDPKAAAAIVNDHVIFEAAVRRGLRGVPETEQARARAEIVEYLIDNALIDQYLIGQKVEVAPKDVEQRYEMIKSELKKNGQDLARMMQVLSLTDEEMRQQITADLRWEQYCNTQAGEAVLKQMFEQNIEMFDSSMVRARHILLKGGDATTARAKLTDMKRQIETAAAAALAKLPADADAATRAAARAKAVDDTFAEVAREHSDCPSKKEGGDLNYFPRSGSMVEPFAQAAFSLKLFEISDPVATPFGYHLILATARKAGMPVKFDDVRDAVFSVYTVRLRDSLLAQLRPMAKISIPPVKSTP